MRTYAFAAATITLIAARFRFGKSGITTSNAPFRDHILPAIAVSALLLVDYMAAAETATPQDGHLASNTFESSNKWDPLEDYSGRTFRSMALTVTKGSMSPGIRTLILEWDEFAISDPLQNPVKTSSLADPIPQDASKPSTQEIPGYINSESHLEVSSDLIHLGANTISESI